jgi:hypothetical protein
MRDQVTAAYLSHYRFPRTRDLDEFRTVMSGVWGGAQGRADDADGYPEVYVYVTSAGGGSYGSLIAYASNRNRSISSISLPLLEDDPDAAKGYMGHDRFVVGEGSLVRNFPIYKDEDTNAAPTGGTRQIQSRLQAGEAGWRLEPDKVFDF